MGFSRAGWTRTQMRSRRAGGEGACLTDGWLAVAFPTNRGCRLRLRHSAWKTGPPFLQRHHWPLPALHGTEIGFAAKNTKIASAFKECSAANVTAHSQRQLFRRLGFLCLPFFLVLCVAAFNTVNPMALIFLTPFEVMNATGQDIYVTPIGAIGPHGRRSTLPLSVSERFYFLTQQRSEFLLPSHSSRKFVYDTDDIQFSEILCRTQGGPHQVISTGLHPTEHQYRAPQQRRFEISDFASLPLASEQHIAALEEKGGNPWLLGGLAMAGLLSPLFFRLAKRIPHAATSNLE